VANNQFYCVELLETLISVYLPNVPLWSSLMLGDLSRHVKKKPDSSKFYVHLKKICASTDFSRMTGPQEQRFTVLKQDALKGVKVTRLNDFTCKLYHFVEV